MPEPGKKKPKAPRRRHFRATRHSTFSGTSGFAKQARWSVLRLCFPRAKNVPAKHSSTGRLHLILRAGGQCPSYLGLRVSSRLFGRRLFLVRQRLRPRSIVQQPFAKRACDFSADCEQAKCRLLYKLPLLQRQHGSKVRQLSQHRGVCRNCYQASCCRRHRLCFLPRGTSRRGLSARTLRAGHMHRMSQRCQHDRLQRATSTHSSRRNIWLSGC